MKKVKKAIIPVAGLGTRFLPATISCPKEMLTIVDKPVIQYIVEEAVAAGIEDILFITRPGKESIFNHFSPSSDLLETLRSKNKNKELELVTNISKLANFSYANQELQKGLAHAVYQGKKFVGIDPFVLLLGDTIIDSQREKTSLQIMTELFSNNDTPSVLVEKLERKEDASKYGIVDINLKSEQQYIENKYFSVDDLVEKPDPKDAPSDYFISCRYIFHSDVFDYIEKIKPGSGGEYQITDAMKFLAKNGEMIALISKDKKYDIGNKTEFVKANIDYGLRRDDTKSEIGEFISKLK